MTDAGLEIDVAAAINRRLHMDALAETEVAFDHGIGRIDAVDDDGHAGAAGNHDIEALARPGPAAPFPIKIASASPTRIASKSRFAVHNLTERPATKC